MQTEAVRNESHLSKNLPMAEAMAASPIMLRYMRVASSMAFAGWASYFSLNNFLILGSLGSRVNEEVTAAPMLNVEKLMFYKLA